MQIPIVIDVTSTQLVPTKTEYQPCSVTTPSAPSSAPALSPSPSPTSPQPSSSADHPLNQSFFTSSILILSTPSPSTSVMTSYTTLANGQVSVMLHTSVYSPSPTSVYVLTTSLVTEFPSDGTRDPSKLGAIVGGIFGGAAGLLLIVALLLFIRFGTQISFTLDRSN
jgi:hypothetical protein